MSGRGQNCLSSHKKSKKFRWLSPAYILAVNIDLIGEAAQKMAHFFNKKNLKKDVLFCDSKIFLTPSKKISYVVRPPIKKFIDPPPEIFIYPLLAKNPVPLTVNGQTLLHVCIDFFPDRFRGKVRPF